MTGDNENLEGYAVAIAQRWFRQARFQCRRQIASPIQITAPRSRMANGNIRALVTNRLLNSDLATMR